MRSLSPIVLLCTIATAEPPAIPLITHDPYFSVWSMTSKLNEDWPRHWSGKTFGMSGLVRVDGQTFRWCGALPTQATPATQLVVNINTTSTAYIFRAGPIELNVRFNSPTVLASDPVLASMSISALEFAAHSTDNASHRVEVYFDITGEWCTADSSESVIWSRAKASELDVLSIGGSDQRILGTSGDRITINWGRAIVAVLAGSTTTTSFGSHHAKTDWTAWSACLSLRRSDFDAIMTPLYEWSDLTPPPSRVPLTD